MMVNTRKAHWHANVIQNIKYFVELIGGDDLTFFRFFGNISWKNWLHKDC